MLRLRVPSLALLVSTTFAAIQKQCPSTNVCYSLNIPNTTLSSGTGDIYIQITAPTSYSWVGIGQGSSMSGANYFIVYSSSSGTNVTVSPRTSSSQTMPTYSSSTKYQVLDGSGISNGVMTANIKCSNCNSWSGGSMDLSSKSTSTNWIHAIKSGSALNTDSTSATIRQHDDYGAFTFGTASHGGSDTNPFTSAASNSTTTTTGGEAMMGGFSNRKVMITAHAVLACLAWAFIFPFGGILIRLFSFPSLLHVHAGVQIFGLCAYIAAVGIALSFSVGTPFISNKHAIIGLVLLAYFLLQPISGFMHHHLFKKYMSRTLWSHLHLWAGRLCITLGMINAGFGFELGRVGLDSWELKTYIACAVIMWVAYVTSAVVGELRRKSRMQNQLAEKGGPESGDEAGLTASPMSPMSPTSMNSPRYGNYR